jgi:glycosyltransferase involved in cell wall biosynthesis
MIGTKKMHIALILLNNARAGGASSYECEVIKSISLYEHPEFDFIIYVPRSLFKKTKEQFEAFTVRSYKAGLLALFFLNLRVALSGYKLLKSIGMKYGRLERKLRRDDISLAYFLCPNAIALDLVDTPMINTVWDLGHRDLPEFLEITGDRHFEERELFYRMALPKSFRVVVDTERTSERIQSVYGVLKDKVIVGGLAPTKPSVPEFRSSNTEHFFLYPAQFWPHKRHVLLLEAFKIVCNKNSDCKLILTGSDKGNLEHVVQKAKTLGISERTEFMGFVDSTKLATLMQNALCLVFPSQLGPSNLPPLEAAMLGTRSLISNVHSDPMLSHSLITIVPSQNAEDWAEAMLHILTEKDPSFKALPDTESQLLSQLFSSFSEFKSHREEWAH